ncbi:MAG: radical SAM protein [Desulfuromonas sp.]|nr:radical SAM protein [Desulfuromonas sp.]
MYKHLFGPVPSRRLGMSLGVDLVPKKVCSYDCVYCEVGKTTRLTLERKEYVRYQDIVSELQHYLAHNPDPDYITFSGSGEPTLNSRIGDVIDFIKELRPDLPLALLTNGSLFYDADVRREICKADLVLPSLDAGTNAVFSAINRPAAGLDFAAYVQGLIDFRQEFSGKIWLEVFILPGCNDSEEELAQLAALVRKISPDSVQINTLDRPGTEAGLHSATPEQLQHIADVLSHGFQGKVELIAAAAKRSGLAAYRTDIESAILETIVRRPCTLDDLCRILGIHANEVNKYLAVLEEGAKIKTVEQDRGVFYQTV